MFKLNKFWKDLNSNNRISKITFYLVSTLLYAVLFTACPKERKGISGIVAVSSEVQILIIPSENNQEYWLENSPLLDQFPTLTSEPGFTKYQVVVDGWSDSGGKYGHLGKWGSNFKIEKIIQKELVK